MSKVFAPKPPKGPIETAITAQSTRAGKRNARFNAAFAEAQKIQTFERDGMVLTVISPPLIVGDHRAIAFRVSAVKDGVHQDIDQSRWIHNPICKLPDGTWRTETIEALVIELENMKESPREATEQVLLDSVIEHPR